MDTSQQFFGFLNSVAATVVWVLIGVVLLFGAVKLIDRFDPLDFAAEIRRGNVAAAILLAAYLLGLAYIIATVIRSPG